MFNNVKAKKRLTQALIAFVVICMSVTGSFMLLNDTIEEATAATTSVSVNSADTWRNALSGKGNGDIVNITLTGDIKASALLQAIPTGVTVNLNMSNKSIYWDTVATGTKDIMDENYADGIRSDFWGLITNNGTLNITGTGTIRMRKVNYNYTNNGQRDQFATRSCAIVNNGTMTIGSGITVENNTAMCANNTSGSYRYTDLFVYGCAIYNNSGTLTTSGTIISSTMGGGTAVASNNSYHYAFSYGIYGGKVTTRGGSVSSEAKSGALMASGTCKEGNQVVSVATGIYSNGAQILGDTTITSRTQTWDSPGGYDCWSDGIDISISTGVMYTGTNYPVIGASVDINSTFFCSAGSEVQVYVPGTNEYYTVKNKDHPANYARRAYPVAGAVKVQNTIGTHSAEKTWDSDGGFFGTPSSGSNNVENNFNMNGNMYYYPEEAYFGNEKVTTSLAVNANSQFKRETGANDYQEATGSFKSGVPGTTGTQFKVMYRYYEGSMSSANLLRVSATPDTAMHNQATINVGGAANKTGAATDAGAAFTFGSGGESKNSYYYELYSKTYEKVATGTFANRDYSNKGHWSNNATLFTGSVNMSSENTLVVYMNYILKDPSAVRVVASNNTIAYDSTSTSFTVKYTGKTIVPGTDFNLGIIDTGTLSDTSDDTVVTSVYDISGNGAGSGNNATAVTYKYSTDQTTWTDGLPKNAGTYTIEVNVNADTTFASSGTYNRLAATQRVSCTITKANVEISGSNSKTGVYGSTYAELVPYGDYTAKGLASEGISGSWSFAGVDAGAYPKAGQHTVFLVWTPNAGTESANNYNSTTFEVALNVTKRNVTVNAGNSTVAYGDSKPAYTFDFAGTLAECDKAKVAEWLSGSTFLVNGSAYEAGINAGAYTLTVGEFGGEADENNTFTINASNGTLNVTPREIVYNATAIDRAYNGSAEVDVKLNYESGNYKNDAYDTVISTVGTMPAGANAGDGKQVKLDADSIIIKNFNNYKLVIKNIDSVTVNIAKAIPTGVRVEASPSNIVYDSTKSLVSATSLNAVETAIPGAWSWVDSSIVPTVDIASYKAKFTPSDTVNYTTIEQDVLLTVDQKEVIVSVKDFTISYGDAVPAISGSLVYSGFTGVDNVSSIGANGGVDATTTYTRGSAVGTYPVTVISTLTSTNYYFTAQNNAIVVNPRALKVTAIDQTVTYGAAVPEFDATDLKFEGFYGSENYAVLSGNANITTDYLPGSDVGSYAITVKGYSSTNYAIEYVNGALTVEKAVLKVTPNNVKGVTYGADAPAYAANKLYSFTGFVAGDRVDTVEISGTPAFSTGYVSGSSVGTYPVTVSVNTLESKNYSFVGVEGSLVVGKATPSVTGVPGATVVNSHTYAEAIFDGTETVVNPNNATLEVDGRFAFANGSTVAVWGSDGFVEVVFTPNDTVNYNTVTAEVYLEILEKAISGIPVIQGSAMSGSTLTVNLASMDPAVAQYYTIQWYADNAPIAGAYGTTYKLADSDIGKQFYVVLVANQELGFKGTATSDKTAAVIQALLETTKDNFSVVFSNVEYDAMSHSVSVSIADGFNPAYFGALTVKYNGSTTLPVNAGKYLVTVDVGTPAMPQGGYPADTYYGPATGIELGTFEITRAPYTVTVLANDKVYDGTISATATVTGSGLKDEMDDVRIAEGSKFAFADAKVGTDKEVTVTSMQLIGKQANNYQIVVSTATANITPRTLKVRVSGVTKVYDGLTAINVTFSNIEGYAPVDSSSTVYLTNGTATAVSANAGTQYIKDIKCVKGGVNADNYVIVYDNAATATVIITPATPNVEAPVIYGVEYDAAKTLQTIDLTPYTTSGGFWQFNDLTIVPTVSQKTYAATFKSTNKNYTDYTTTITVNVDPKAVLLIADDKTVSYGTKAPVFTITASGLTGEDTLADIGGSCTPVCTYAPGSSIGSYTINLNNALSDDNYTFTTQAGTLTVAPARITVTATAVNRVYNGTSDITVNFDKNLTGKYGNDDVSLSTFTTVGQSATPNAGPTTVTYTAPVLTGSKADNYELYISPASGTLTVTIAKADIAGVTFPVDGQVEFGYDLRYATFAVNGVGDGTFAYENAKDIVPPALGFYEYKVIFTPTDARNYNTQEAMISLEVVKCVLDYVVGIAGTAQTGETLTVVTTGLPASAANYIQYQWYRTDGTEVEVIEGATSVKYVATEEDVGYTLLVITYFNDADPYVYADSANAESIDGEVYGIIGQSANAIKEVALSFWQRLINWLNRIIAVLTGVQLGGIL